MSPLRDLDQPCAACQRPRGDHTLREFSTCLGARTFDLPYEDLEQDATAAAAGEALRKSFSIPGDVIVADHVVVRALTLDGGSGGLRVRLPGLMHEFQIGVQGKPPVLQAKVLFAGGLDSIRGYGRLVRDSANGAANAAERAQ